MANSRLSALTGATPAAADSVYFVDASDTTDNAAGSSRKATLSALFGEALTLNSDIVDKNTTQTLTNKTFTGLVLTPPQINDTSSDHQYVFALSELSADRTVTLPLLIGDDTFVFKDFTQTLTNKTFSLTSNTLTGTTAEFNTALSDGNFATQAGSETLTNKTIDGDDNTLTDIPVANLKVASQATGDVLYASSSSAWARLGVGTSGIFLKTRGAGSAPIWAAAPGLVIIGAATCTGSTNANSATFVDITGMTTTLALGASNYTVCVWVTQGINGDTVADQATVRVVIGATNGNESYLIIDVNTAAAAWPVAPNFRLINQTGNVICKAQVARQSGSGTVTAANAHGMLLAIAFPE